MRRRPTAQTLVALALLALAGLWPAAQAHAGTLPQAAGVVRLDVRLGFDGYVQTGAWTPITVVASNDGPDLDGELRVEVDPLTGSRTLYTRAIDLPQGSRKAVTLYVADITAFGNEVRVDLAGRGRIVASERVRLATVSPTTLLVGVWSDTPQALAALDGVKPSSGEVRLVLLGAGDLPDSPVGWQALDALVVADADTGQLSPSQRDALRAWLASGGRLVVVGGVGFQRSLSGFADLLPVSVEGTQTVSVGPLAELAGVPFPPQALLDAPVATGSLAPGARLLAQSGSVTLAASRSLGYGRVAYLAADPGLEPLRSWDGMEALWRALLSGGEPRPAWGYGFASQWDYARQAVVAVPGVSLPSVIQLCGFLLLYVALVGPVNYIVLTRLKRRELAWFTIPALILVFSAIAYVTGFQLRGSRAILHRLAVVQTWPDEDVAEVNALVGVWSPRRARYDVMLEPGYLARPMPRDLGGVLATASEAQVDQGEAVSLRGLRVDVGSVQALVIEGFSEAPRISAELTIRAGPDGLRVTGPLSNASDLTLRDASLALGGAVVSLGDLPAGQVLQVDVAVPGGQAARAPGSPLDPFPADGGWGYMGSYDAFVTGVAGGDCFATPADRLRCNLLLSVLNGQAYGSGLTLFGWADSVPFTTQVIGAGADNVDTALVVAALPSHLSVGGQGALEVPPGLMTWRALEDAYGYVTPYDLYLYSGQEASFRFEPSAIVPPLAVEALDLHLETPYSEGQPPLVMLRNVQTGRWDALALVDYGVTTVRDAERYVDAAGGVEARLLAPSDGFGLQISRFEVSLRGTLLAVR